MKESLSLSVIMPAFNAGKYISASIESILNQTFTDFELLIVDDGSTDDTVSKIKSFKDKRINIISQKNSGVSASRNKAIRLAKGEYIAMHDADDISYPERFDTQIRFLRKNPEIGLVGCTLEAVDKDDSFMYYINLLTHPDDLKLAEILSNQIGQGAVMLRSELLKQYGHYDVGLKYAEDADLWRRLSHHTKLANIKTPLYRYRVHESGASQNIEMIRKMVFISRDREFKYFLKNRKDFRLISFHPLSMHGGVVVYLKRKSDVYSRLSLMYCYSGMRKKSILPIIMAIAHAPWEIKNYRQFLIMVSDGEAARSIRYELF